MSRAAPSRKFAGCAFRSPSTPATQEHVRPAVFDVLARRHKAAGLGTGASSHVFQVMADPAKPFGGIEWKGDGFHVPRQHPSPEAAPDQVWIGDEQIDRDAFYGLHDRLPVGPVGDPVALQPNCWFPPDA